MLPRACSGATRTLMTTGHQAWHFRGAAELRAASPTWMSITLLLGSYLDWNFSGCIMTNFPGETFKNLAISVLKVWWNL